MASIEAARSAGSPAPMSRRQVPAAHRFLSPHQAAVLQAAIRQLIPVAEEADVVGHLDRLLTRFDTRAGSRRVRIVDLRDHCTNGIALLDQLADGDFTAVPPLRQGLLVSHVQAEPFTSLLCDHIVAAMYAAPDRSPCDAAAGHRETG